MLRDLDLLADIARDGLVSVAVSVTTLEHELKRVIEPRAASPQARLRTLAALNAAGVPTGVLVAPVIPALTDHEMEAILEAAAAAGARWAGYVLLRLPYEIKDLFREWLAEHYPERAAHVMSLIRDMRGGRDNDPSFGSRMSGTGPVRRAAAQPLPLLGGCLDNLHAEPACCSRTRAVPLARSRRGAAEPGPRAAPGRGRQRALRAPPGERRPKACLTGKRHAGAGLTGRL